jgi:hypothetical protein
MIIYSLSIIYADFKCLMYSTSLALKEMSKTRDSSYIFVQIRNSDKVAKWLPLLTK